MKFILALSLLCLAIAMAKVQPSAFSIGLSPTMQQCPPGIKGYATYCGVGTVATGFQTFVSYDGQAYTVLP